MASRLKTNTRAVLLRDLIGIIYIVDIRDTFKKHLSLKMGEKLRNMSLTWSEMFLKKNVW